MSSNKRVLIVTAGVVGLAAVAHAQVGVAGVSGVERGASFQYFYNAEPGLTTVRADSLGSKPITGKPLSATEVRRTRQTLGDGTHIDKTDKSKYYRDFEGRTRIDREGGGNVTISYTGAGRGEVGVAGPRTFVRSGNFSVATPPPVPVPPPGGALTAERMIGIAEPADIVIRKDMLDKTKAELAFSNEIRQTFGPNVFTRTIASPAVAVDNRTSENLGDQIVNGVMARGTRTTITIPLGQIGNDREIKVVSERWFSEDLGLLIRSTNSDPRFGETTFELTDILQGAQDPTLFEMPSGPVKRN